MDRFQYRIIVYCADGTGAVKQEGADTLPNIGYYVAQWQGMCCDNEPRLVLALNTIAIN